LCSVNPACTIAAKPPMDSENGSLQETYVVSCFACQAPFDALQGCWCGCLVAKRTVVCPSCLNCFCKAPVSYRQRFWELAPQGMWDRAIFESRNAFEPPPNPRPQEMARPIVLVVDDERDIQRVALHAIGTLGYGAVLAADGAQGLELAKKYRPDLILTDAFMPKLDGREMCRKLKEDPATAGLKIVVMTGIYTAARYRSEAFREFHADDYLSKPIEFRELRALLQKYLGNHVEG